ncbi:MAG: hypothetical protein BWK76_07290 [Desulfobulbaceae bacterium A2]|uniref:LbtU family siderophore porin n=1 Tax=Rhodoferax ferrireducens TaxID=192843 RepID=A0A1W9KP59_9BURK|nr:MAG: hypothetical protein BWK72_19700 [Rhodoferax ferrireducens]OQX18513.1 MAG: hypothetical protein BWK76_07290 [Desulfobulbaceae bacterium A2]
MKKFLNSTMVATALVLGAAGGAVAGAEEKAPLGKINDALTVTALLETEFSSAKNFAGESSSDLTLSTVELGFDFTPTDWAAAHVLLKYEEGKNDNDIEIDEAFFTLGNAEHFPLKFTAGKFVLPFGVFATKMIQDPLTQELGEINKTAVALGVESNGFVAALFGYKGMGEIGATDDVRGMGAMLGYGYEADTTKLRFSLSWVNNIADAGTVEDFLDEQGFEAVQDEVAGLALSAGATFGPVSLSAEYVAALDNYDPAQFAFGADGAKPRAWQAEVAYTMEIMERETVFALGYQGTSEALALGLPETRLLAAASVELVPHINLALEYFHDEDYGIADGGTGEGADTVTLKLAFEL